MSNKDLAVNNFEKFIKLVKNRFNSHILRCNRGDEFTSKAFLNIITKNGIEPQFTAPYSPHQNGVSERKNLTLCQIARSLLFQAGLKSEFWAEAIDFANYITNHIPSKSNNDLLLMELLTSKSYKLNHLYSFGYKAKILIKGHYITKFESKTTLYIYLGPSNTGNGNKFWNIHTKRLITSRNAYFFEEFDNSVTFSLNITIPNPFSNPVPMFNKLNNSSNSIILEFFSNSEEDEDSDKDNLLLLNRRSYPWITNISNNPNKSSIES